MNNPFFEKNTQPYGAVPFELIKSEHYLPAIKKFVEKSYNNVALICENKEEPTFENTILAFECAFEDLDYAGTVYRHMFGSEADSVIRELIKDINPLITKLYNDVYLNETLFDKIKKVDSIKDSFQEDERKLTEELYTSFVRGGANLDSDNKSKLREISQELAKLSPEFSNNVLNATNEINDFWVSDLDDVLGMPENCIESAKLKAQNKEKKDEWCFSLDTDFFIFMKSCSNRSLRKRLMELTSSKCNGGKHDNTKILNRIASLRYKKAKILGYDTHADYTLDRRMAKNKNTVYSFIDDLIKPSFAAASKELEEITKYAKEIDDIEKIEAYDLLYYGEQYKKYKFDFDDELLRPYFKAENVISGVFEVAKRLYGLKFNKLSNIQVFHPEVVVYEVKDSNDNYIGLLYQDLHPRKTKRGGAWMNQLKAMGYYKGRTQEPHVTFNCNLTRSTDTKPALLSITEVRTVFHEFGHCLHGLLTNVKYQSLGAMSVYWDFVELPSQILENWLKEPEVLNIFAKHYETGESIPQEYIDKINDSKKYMAGTMSLRQLHLCKIDMAWHDQYSEKDDIEKFEKELLDKYTLVPKVNGAAVSPAFSHIFSGGYSAGYYSYKWAELLEADAYEKFKNDGIFNKDTASSFKNNILSKGNTDHPMNLFENFMGRKPSVDALLRKGGLNQLQEVKI